MKRSTRDAGTRTSDCCQREGGRAAAATWMDRKDGWECARCCLFEEVVAEPKARSRRQGFRGAVTTDHASCWWGKKMARDAVQIQRSSETNCSHEP